MDKSILIIGSSGRMSQELQAACKSQSKGFTLWASTQSAPENPRALSGIIDFSTPETSLKILDFATRSQLPLVCGTTGWKDSANAEKQFRSAAVKIAIVKDSNFSQGIEILCQLSALLAAKSKRPLSITDLHHDKKKDAPSGTALKIKDRISKVSAESIQTQSIRLGDIPGEHRVLVSFQDQTLEIVHRAHSRRPFAEGALAALQWAENQKPGLYTMEDIFK